MYTYKFKLKRIVDGDTVDGFIDLGFNVSIKVRVRLSGIDTPESRTRNLREKKYGFEAKDRLSELLDSDDIIIKSHGLGKYGRVLGTFYVDDVDINRAMIEEGYAIEYNGDKKITTEELLEILDSVRSCQQ